MRKLLLFHGCLPPYRIDLFNAISKVFEAKAILLCKEKELQKLGFNYEDVEKRAEILFEWHNKGLFLGNHLLSLIYFKVIRSMNPDVVWCQELGINTLASILLKGFFHYKLIICVDDSPVMLEQYGMLRKLLRKFVYKYVDEVLVVHCDVQKQLSISFPKTQIYYLPIIQDEIVFEGKLENSKVQADTYVDKYKLQDKTVFLFVGRLEPEKCPLFLLETFHAANMNNTVLVFVGAGTLEGQMKAYVLSNHLEDKVIMTGNLQGDRLFAWYNVADYLVLPSQFEPFGAVVNEALISGCKVIVSDRVGASTLLSSSNGYVFPCNDSMALIRIIIKCCTDGKKKKVVNLMGMTFGKMCDSFIGNLYRLCDN